MTTAATATPDDVFLLGGETSVRRVGFGAMRLTDATGDGTQAGARIWRAPADPADAVLVLRRAVELGVQLLDTADAYALGENEALIAAALHPYPEDLVIATKVGHLRPSPTEWVPLGHPAYLRQQVELGLRRLRTETLDLVQLHRLDPAYPLADQVGALAELREQGKVRHVGLSEVTVEELEEARRVTPIASVQNHYNLAERHHEALLDHCLDAGVAFIPFFPLAIGDLARPGSAVDAVAAELGATRSQVALSWLLHRAPHVLPIPGTTSVTHLEENTAAVRLALNDDQLQRLGTTLAP
ncbi:Predicted oxidoreductase [Quadrisphaera granulorum]|uniref:Aryl-alcohol dehydrogenase-like predicted oxidoreductase n=1 Tax=Quadrisphaera granulorum TaxID=317664 RepID=A0A316A8K9_9ACTN|nr:aldo/keto reductase [Quadrisphaera granulorum]PWJ53164.1 aryl-alcohol dehydrogenase-like predicted oxidoreductase [Quadrisphaera granulorum]SZE97096.1 Predicted oxidoreductase [Quadrisphaera granulorum]